MIGHYALTELNCSVDSADLIPEIPRERFKFVLFPWIDGSDFSCDIVRRLCDCYAKDQIFIKWYVIVRCSGMSLKQFFPNAQRPELDESTYRKVKSMDRMFLYVSLPALRSRMQWNSKMYAYVFSEPGDESDARNWEEIAADGPYAPAVEHAGLFSSKTEPTFHLFSYLSDTDVNFGGNACLGITDDDDDEG